MHVPRAARRTALTLLSVLTMSTAVAVAGPATSALAAVDPGLGYDPVADQGSLFHITKAIGAQDSWKAGYTGKGVGVALIDTGVSRVPGLTGTNVVDGPDLSFESQYPNLAHNDGFGHGTHMASIIAGSDVAPGGTYADPTRFVGVAPQATLVDVKVAAHDGGADVSQVIAAIDWVVEHKDDPGLNIRVLNLSYGTDSTASYMTDPLSYAVENAWRHGIVVVVAGGNDGSSLWNLANPAQDPYVLAVGADDTRGTLSATDDVVPAFANRGSNTRHVDLVAPAMHVLGLKSPGSVADLENPSASVGDRFLRGTGTSQAAAVVSGAAALLLQRYPTATPDQVKRQLMSTSAAFSSTTNQYRGNGLVNVRTAQTNKLNTSQQSPQFFATGGGTLEGSRGSIHVNDGVADLTGELDIFDVPFDSAAWTTATTGGTAWTGGDWNGTTWAGDGFDDARAWKVAPWLRGTWNGRAWSDSSWTGRAWSGRAWSDGAWEGRAWSGRAWSGRAWSAENWG